MKALKIIGGILLGLGVLITVISLIVSSCSKNITPPSDDKEKVENAGGGNNPPATTTNDTVVDIISSRTGSEGYIGQYAADIFTFGDDSVYIKFNGSSQWILHTKDGGPVPSDATYGNALFKGTKKHPNVRVVAVRTN